MKHVSGIFIAFFFLAFVSCQEKSKKDTIKVLDISSFDKKLSETSSKIILDVRTPSEYEAGHLQNSVLIDIKNSSFEDDVNKLDKTKPVFVYCAAGIRSEKAALILEKKGFKEIYHMDGGLQAWEDENRPVVKY